MTEDDANRSGKSGEAGEAGEEEWSHARALLKAKRLLGPRDHASSELRRKLRERDVPASVVDGVVEELRETGDLDDERFAAHQASILADKGWGPRRIRQKLRERGVERALVDRVVDDLGGPERWFRACYDRAVDKFGEELGELERRERESAFRHLKHRGFTPSHIRRVLLDGEEP